MNFQNPVLYREILCRRSTGNIVCTKKITADSKIMEDYWLEKWEMQKVLGEYVDFISSGTLRKEWTYHTQVQTLQAKSEKTEWLENNDYEHDVHEKSKRNNERRKQAGNKTSLTVKSRLSKTSTLKTGNSETFPW